MHNWFDQLGLRAKITIGFLVLILLTLAAGMVSLTSHRRAQAAVDNFVDRDNQIAELTLMSSAMMLKARRNEKDFLLRVREFGFNEAKARYVMLVHNHIATLHDYMRTIRSLDPAPHIQEETVAIDNAATRYETGFMKIVELHSLMGRHTDGLQGQFRDRAHAIEALIKAHGSPPLMVDLLGLRRNEKDYLLRGFDQYHIEFRRNAGRFKEDIANSDMPAGVKKEMLRLTDEYQALFQRHVDVYSEIEAASLDYLGAVHAVEPMLEHLHAYGGKAAVTTRNTLDRLSVTTMWTVVGASVVALVLGIIVALFISRSVNRSLRECVDFAGKIATGNMTSRLLSRSRDEFGVLITAMNRMVDSLQAAYRRQNEQAAELHRLNRTLRVLSECNETLVRTQCEAELLDTVCQHLVQTGGYRVAWVGFARHDQDKRIDMVAHAGTDRDFVAHLDLSWGDDATRQGVSGVAIREGKMTVVRGIGSDPVVARFCEDALRRGFASCIALPMRANAEILGTLTIYAEESDAFDAEEIKVLQELSDNLSYGIGSLRETEKRKRVERELERQANFDALTGLANRFTLETRLAQALGDASRNERKVAMLFIDLDRFKPINDTLGHAIGDRLLIEIGRRINAAVRESDTVARFGGDEFVVILTNVDSTADIAKVAGQIIALVNEPVQLDQHEIRPIASVGVSVFPDDSGNGSTMIKNADIAMYHAKSFGGNTFRFFAPEMNAHMAARFAMESDLRHALHRNELRVHFQPQVSLTTGEVIGAEALVRWHHPAKGMVPPMDFIPLAEETGLIQPLGEWMIRSVCRQMRLWLDAGLPVPTVAVNLSARQLRQDNLVEIVQQALESNRLDASLLGLEITESAVMHDVDAAIKTLEQLKALGVRLSLDDFGTGYSSLSYLKRLPIDHLKIDKSFVQDITIDPDDAAICLAIISLAHNLQLTVIAEGVETEEQMKYLRNQHCDDMQGYYFSRPLPENEFTRLLSVEPQREPPGPAGAGCVKAESAVC